MIKVVLFDVDGTLIRPHPSVGGIYSRVAARHGVRIGGDILDRRFVDAWGRIKKVGQTVSKEWWRKIVDDVFDGHFVPDGELFFEDLYDSFRDPGNWSIFADAEPTLRHLRHQGLRLAVASNWDERLTALLDALGLARYFDRQFISHDLGCSKPDRRFFQAALAGMNALPEETAHVGDDLEEDVRGAGALGILAFHLSRKSPPRGENAISSLLELPRRIKSPAKDGRAG